MTALSYIHRFVSNFVLLAGVYLALNYLSTYQQRAVVAVLVLIYVALQAISVLRSFSFFHKIERLEADMRWMMTRIGAIEPHRKVAVGEVAGLRRAGEIKAYIDLLFIALTILLCISRIVMN
jgi:hypothetical protein